MSDYRFNRHDLAREEGWEWLQRLELSARSHNAIINNKVGSFGELRQMGFDDLMSLPGLGGVGAKEILDKLEVIETNGLSEEYEETYAHEAKPDEGVVEGLEQADNVSVYSLPLSARTANALYNNGVKVVSDLAQYTVGDLNDFQGFGQKALNEVIDLINRPDFGDFLQVKEVKKISLDDFLSNKINRSHLAIADSYFGLTQNPGNKVTFQSVSEQYGVTRERIRQIVKKVSDKIFDAIDNGTLDTEVPDILIAHVNKPLKMLPEISGLYRKEAIVRLFTDHKQSGLSLHSSPSLHSDWLILRGDNKIELEMKQALSALGAQVAPVSIGELSKAYSIDENILYDLNKVTIDSEGFIVLNSNRVALGIDVRQMILDYMDKIVRPVTVTELCKQLGLKENQVKGRLYNMKETVNVGLSTYGLVKYGYTGESIADLSEKLLRENEEPLHIDKITSFVTKYKVVVESSVPAMMSYYPEVFTNIGNGYYALTEWGYEPGGQSRSVYEISAIDAALAVFEEADVPLATKDVLARVKDKYGDKATDNPVTVSAACVKLYKRGVLNRLGTDHSPFYELKQP